MTNGRLMLLAILLVAIPSAQADHIGVKNFRQLIDSFFEATQLPSSNQVLKKLVDSLKPRLPQSGCLTDISSPVTIALAELAGGFCQEQIAADALLAPAARRIHKNVNFKDAPSGISSALQEEIINEYANMYWQRYPAQEELQTLIKSFKTAVAVTGAGSAPPEQQTKLVLKTVCVSVASSLQVLVY